MVIDQKSKKVVVLATGGTIAGRACDVSDNIGYTAGQLGVADLLADVPGLDAVLAHHALLAEQVAQVDSKDMTFAIWQALAQRVSHHLAQPDVVGLVITHGTDTLEETAFFLHAVLPTHLQNAKPVVLTCAMRPATALSPDGPQNLRDAVTTVLTPAAHGVVAVCAGVLYAARDVQKNHTYRLDAFSSGDAGPLGYAEEGQLRLTRNWPVALTSYALDAIHIHGNEVAWPRVEIVMSYAGCSGAVVEALMDQASAAMPLQGIVVAGTGNGTLHAELEVALRRATRAGIRVVRATRCANGRVLATVSSEFDDSKGLSPVKARIALMLELMQAA